VLQQFAAQGLRPRYTHAANSAGLYRYPESHGTLVRPGIALYGAHPFVAPEAEALRPVLTWKTRLIRVQAVPVGYGMSYGHTFVTSRASLIGTLPVGYADGLSRHLSNVGYVLIHGQRVPIVGQICMDMCLVDLTDLAYAHVGDEVVLLGTQRNAQITAEEMAARCSRIPYEVFCAISQRVPRRYVEAENAVCH
jgi:alanine racemase